VKLPWIFDHSRRAAAVTGGRSPCFARENAGLFLLDMLDVYTVVAIEFEKACGGAVGVE